MILLLLLLSTTTTKNMVPILGLKPLTKMAIMVKRETPWSGVFLISCQWLYFCILSLWSWKKILCWTTLNSLQRITRSDFIYFPPEMVEVHMKSMIVFMWIWNKLYCTLNKMKSMSWGMSCFKWEMLVKWGEMTS